jgi:hypothetical protein
MKSQQMRVDCEYLSFLRSEVRGIGGQLMVSHVAQCNCGSAPNSYPGTGRLFVDNCAECEHNRWTPDSP